MVAAEEVGVDTAAEAVADEVAGVEALPARTVLLLAALVGGDRSSVQPIIDDFSFCCLRHAFRSRRPCTSGLFL